MTDIIIIGAGPAGFTAAIYAVRYGMSVLLFEKNIYGGQAAVSSDIENYPGIEKISGAELAMNLYEQAKRLGVKINQEEVIAAQLEGKDKRVKTKSGQYKAKSVIVTNGAKRRLLNCPGEKEFFGKGVSYCATCDGAFYKDKEVFLVGGGNTALEDALFLTKHCSKVTIVHRRDEFRAMKSYVDAVMKNEKVEILYDSEVIEIKGSMGVNAVVIKNKMTEKISEYSAHGIFITIGFEADNEWLNNQLELDKSGYFISDESCQTNIDGVYVAGDCRNKLLKQIVTAASDGAIAAFQATNYIHTN